MSLQPAESPRKLNRSESSYVKDSLLEGMSFGESKELSKVRREFLAEELHCSEGQIAGFRAGLTRAAQSVIRSNALALREEDLFLAAKYVSLASGPAAREQACMELSQHLGIDSSSIEAAVDAFSRLIDGAASSKRRDGSHVKFDNLVKEEWRHEWAGFIAQYMPPTELAEAYVLCLPSVDVMLEVSHYLKLGIRPENILAIEGGTNHDVFAVNAKAAGIRYRLGQLEDIVPTLDERFHIVNYDFCGPASLTNRHIIQHTPLADKAIVILNLMASRESPQLQDHYQRVMEFFGMKKPDEWCDIKVHRERDVEGMMLNGIGMLRKPQPEHADYLSLSQDALMEVGSGMSAALKRYDAKLFEDLAPALVFGGPSVVQGYPLASARAFRKYWSESSGSHIPFISTFQLYHRPEGEQARPFFETFRELLAVGKALAAARSIDGDARASFCVRDEQGAPLSAGRSLTEGCHLTAEIGGMRVSSQPMTEVAPRVLQMRSIIDALLLPLRQQPADGDDRKIIEGRSAERAPI